MQEPNTCNNEKALLKCKPSALIFGRGRAKELFARAQYSEKAHASRVNEHVTESVRKTIKAAKALYG